MTDSTQTAAEVENERHRRANLVRAVLDGYGDRDVFVNEAIKAKDFDRVPWLIAEKAVAERIRPAEQALIAAALAWFDEPYQSVQDVFFDAARAYREARDDA